ncbi:hypothetical protein JY651_37675 [Pyxidicoccus parkwayensis]|uniref:EGF-like domain-containing protein n=1 Tax=Pyxidicoccus parkwayensis TaxID=2813578 RepID=A0ABX7NPY6_9BACT|nr:hypothetical protein [Pyxidicoccus parkwaysis]QSQ20912.1 hypothetical protein JY651_37675 [Pyxidicoccus parkwaysis]
MAVTVLSYFLVMSFAAERPAACDQAEPQACVPHVSEAPPSAEPPPATSVTVAYQAAGTGGAGAVVDHASTDLHVAARKPDQVRSSSAPVSSEGDDASEEVATLLDGRKGPRPSNLMNCQFDGGTFRCGECTTDSDCPAGQGCVIDYGKGTFTCAASECEDDSHCFPGSVCRVAAGGAPGPVIRRCLQTGVRLLGEPCSRLPATRDEACEEGLLCINHHCGTPCTPGEAGTCPDGYTCEESPSGAACLPDCRKLGCSSDKQCAPLNGGAFQCLDLVVDECSDEKPCAGGAQCIVRGRGGRAGRFCAAACDSWKVESCGGNQVCGIGGPTGSACYAKCDPQDLDTCPQGWLCTTVTEDLQTWGCLPDFMSGAPSTPHPRTRAMAPSP